MKPQNINNIFTRIFKGQQKVGFEVEGLDKYIYLLPSNIKQCTGVSINEIEILIDSKIRPEFYKQGEIMFNGLKCSSDRFFIKDFWIECSGTIAEMKDRNKGKLKPLKEILKVFQFQRNGKNIVGFETWDEKATFIDSNRLQKLTKLSADNFYILKGSFINPEYYKEGEEIYAGKTCIKSGVILKDLNLRFYGKTADMKERFSNSISSYSFGNYYDFKDDSCYDSDNWLEEAAGSNDPEIMNDAYWNMD